MTDHDALLAAILAAPEDDAPRLIYADWLEEHGQADRAAFIRVGCEAARLDSLCSKSKSGETCTYDEDECIVCGVEKPSNLNALRRRERDLLLKRDEFVPRWAGWFGLPPHVDGYYLRNIVKAQNQQGIGLLPCRGFVAEIRCPTNPDFPIPETTTLPE